MDLFMQSNSLEKTPESLKSCLYEQDFYAWTQEQAQFLQLKQWDKIDLLNLIEEIESLGKRERAELRNRLSLLIGHLLKWHYQASKRSRSWLMTVRVQRRDTQALLEDNPSLKSYFEEALQKSYESGRDLAVKETNLAIKTFPVNCPYTLAEILSDRFYPGEPTADELME
jgi:Domain of unknown function DUF29